MRLVRGVVLCYSSLLFSGAIAQDRSPAPAGEGPYLVRGVVVEGNKTTKERVVLRELVLQDGDSVPSAEQLYYLLERSRQNLMNTGLFNTASVTPLYIDQSTVLVEVSVNERWYLWPALISCFILPLLTAFSWQQIWILKRYEGGPMAGLPRFRLRSSALDRPDQRIAA